MSNAALGDSEILDPVLSSKDEPLNKKVSDKAVINKLGNRDGSPRTGLHQSASYVHLPSAVAVQETDTVFEASSIKRTLSENVLSNLGSGLPQRNGHSKTSDRAQLTKFNRLTRRKSKLFQKDPKIAISSFVVGDDQVVDDISHVPKAIVRGDPDSKSRSVSTTLSNFARKSWIRPSRSPSPNKRKSIDHGLQTQSPGTSRTTTPPDTTTPPEGEPSSSLSDGVLSNGVGGTNGHFELLQRKGTTVAKGTRRPLSAILGRSESSAKDSIPAVPSLPKSYSFDKLSSLANGQAAGSREQLPRINSADRSQKSLLDTPRKKDELWGNFRSLDVEFQKFSSKPSTYKINMIRGTLLPFLRAYAHHSSNRSLRAEDLDRRVNILNKWWIGLLEMLNGRNGQSVSGNDRPAILEGVTGIMARPEWRLPTSAVSTRTEKGRPVLRSKSSTSLESSSSEFLTESVLHNVRNIFVQNLLSQMAFVVDKMSMRNVPASVVAFCGKATAYAFLFCPTVADILVRLWALPNEIVRRVLNEANISRNVNLSDTADAANRAFPPHLHALAFTSLPSLMRNLRIPLQLPLSSAYIPWNGPWVGRWSGRDSDLFFIFTKYYHVLVSEMMPEDSSKVERLCAPCYVLVQAQVLSVMDATIHKSNNALAESIESALPITFDDVLGADTSAAPMMPLTNTPNNPRTMAENRLIMLLREFLSDSASVKEVARQWFAESYGELLKATARKTSLFNHLACFTLCDFLEEAIVILARYHHGCEDPVSFLDWPFWLQVCKQMLQSNHSMTEVRLYAFIYGLWGLIVKDENRRSDICFDWLLTEEHFHRQFNHWCPMVRAYYMRLLCWRIARFDGYGSDLDLKIFNTLATRLQENWCHFLYILEQAEKKNLVPPSTTPCSPAPGRRLLIVRNDFNVGSGGVFVSFDGIHPPSPSSTSTSDRISSLETSNRLTTVSSRDSSIRSSSPVKKRWGVLKSLIPFSNTSSQNGTSSSAESKIPNGVKMERSEQHDGVSAINRSSNPRTPPSTPHLIHLSFKFSLEWIDRNITVKDRRLYPPRLPLPAQLYLQSKRTQQPESRPVQPSGPAVSLSKYSGRALAEWAILVVECQNFFERRRFEGIPDSKSVETPTLGVESFRRPG